MDFKLTSSKVTISIIAGLILALSFSYTIYTGSSTTRFIFSQSSVFGFIIGLIVTYIILSFFKNKKQ